MREYLMSTGEKVVEKNGLYYLKGGEIQMNEREMRQYLTLQSSKLENINTFPQPMIDAAEYNWKKGI